MNNFKTSKNIKLYLSDLKKGKDLDFPKYQDAIEELLIYALAKDLEKDYNETKIEKQEICV